MTVPANAATGLSKVRRNALIGTALAALIAGAVIGGAIPPTTPARAELVTVDQPVALPSFADVVEAVSPAVVAIRAEGERMQSMIQMPGFDSFQGTPFEDFFFGFPEMDQDPVPTPITSLGSGFFISGDGYVVTNNHVVDEAREFTVITDDGTEYPATLVGRDDQTDLAVLKVDSDEEFSYVEFADADPRVGDWVVAVGNPFGFGGTVTAGIVSGRGRQLTNSAYDDFIQIDAAVNQGNSGGPTFDLSGRVVGVNTAIYSPTGGNVGLAFAVPANVATAVIAEILDSGSVTRGWLGVQIGSVDANIAGALGLDGTTGAIVAAPIAGGPAEGAGILSGDVILEVNGETVQNSTDLALKIGALDPDTVARLTVFRGGEEIEVAVTLGRMGEDSAVAAPTPAPAAEPSAVEALGLELAAREGNVVIAEVDPTGPAADVGLRAGDVLIAVNQQPVSSPAEATAAIAAARDAGRTAVLLQVARNGQPNVVAVPF